MLALISPAKKLEFEENHPEISSQSPHFLNEAEPLIKKLRSLSNKKLSELMDLSKDLTQTNAARYASWEIQDHDSKGVPAVFAFAGDVYQSLDARSLNASELEYVSQHLGILSGLYGYLRPGDKILPYRLEMGTQLPVRRRKNIVDYWKDKLVKHVNHLAEAEGHELIINLASNEYFSAIDTKKLKPEVLTIGFMEEKNGKFKTIGWNAKRARGAYARFMAETKAQNKKDLMEFNADGYGFNDRLSRDSDWVFTRS